MVTWPIVAFSWLSLCLKANVDGLKILSVGRYKRCTSSSDVLKCRFAELHKESRRLENEVDLKLLSFSKLGSSYAQSRYRSEL